MRFVGALLVLVACGYPRPAPLGNSDGSNTQPDGSAGDPPLNLSYAQNPAYFTKLEAGSDAPSVGGGPVTSWSVNPALPGGLTLDATTGVIGGTPTAGVPMAKYTVTAANANGMTSADLELRVNDITAIASGTFHSCAVTAGSVVCWGNDQQGQVGVAPMGNDVNIPSDVPGTVGATAVCGGEQHTCAVINGGVKCWGSNQYGQLGTGTTGGMSMAAQQVVGLPMGGASAVACGQYFTCAIVNGLTWCWGRNDTGELGNGSLNPPMSGQPSQVAGIQQVTAITAESSGRTACAILSTNQMACWGDGNGGEIVPGSGANYPMPQPINGLPAGQIQSITIGDGHACAVVLGMPYCWGNNSHGQTGQQPGGFTNNPTQVPGISTGARIIEAGYFHTCAILISGALCWGFNIQGQLGNAMQLDTNMPQSVQGESGGVTVLAAGASESCSLMNNHMFCWGDGQFHHLGNGSMNDSAVPVPVTGL